ncbi:MAG TPA: hypothetical protein VGB55_02685 [Tepidisphaeraceae bacterium]|jgi:hypothetical protein
MQAEDFAKPLSIVSALVGFRRPWCLAGGWAIDLWLGEVTRQHTGVTIAILRDHQIDLRDHFPTWRFKLQARDGRLFPWKDRQMLMLPVHTLHATGGPGPVRFALQESDGIDWIDRRHFDVRLNLSRWIVQSHGVPVLCPRLALLLKSAGVRPQDQLDFRAALDRLDEDRRTWLKLALMRAAPHHPWLEVL